MDLKNLRKKRVQCARMNFKDLKIMEYKLDGEIHSLGDDYFYIAESYEYENGDRINTSRLKRKFLDKYIWYLFSVNYSHVEIENILKSSKNHFQFIHKKPWDIDKLCKKGTYCMKFKRINRYNSNLEENGIQ